MSYPFHPRSGLILVEAEISGPAGKVGARLVLDTGASSTALNANLLRSIGHNPDLSTDMVRMATGSGVETVPRIMINRVSALGKHAIGLRVLPHTLPVEATFDGLLGLDFFRDALLTIDFRAGQLTLG